MDAYFLPFEAQRIKSIPLCTFPQVDSLFWPLSGVGIYSVKSGYKLLCEDSREAFASGFSLVGKNNFWFGLRNLKVLEKIEHFMWKACTNSLPTKVILLKRKILMDSSYHLYGKAIENTMHALWECEAVRMGWCRDFG